MKSMPLEADLSHFRVWNLHTGGILGGVNLCVNLQSLFGRCSRYQVDDHLEAGQGLPPPVLADERE
jgi:hypothetical protein